MSEIQTTQVESGFVIARKRNLGIFLTTLSVAVMPLPAIGPATNEVLKVGGHVADAFGWVADNLYKGFSVDVGLATGDTGAASASAGE